MCMRPAVRQTVEIAVSGQTVCMNRLQARSRTAGDAVARNIQVPLLDTIGYTQLRAPNTIWKGSSANAFP